MICILTLAMQEDIFTHMFHQDEAQVASNTSSLRIYVDLRIRDWKVKVSVDTGSTFSTAMKSVITAL